MPQKYKLIIGFLTLVAVALVIIWLLGRGKETTDDATIEAHTIPISAKVPGYILKLKVNDNQPVKKGQVLVEIDPRDYILQRDAALALLRSAEVKALNASINAKRQLAIGRAAGTQKEIDDTMALEKTGKSNVENARAQLAIAEKNLNDTKIIAPEDGIVTMRTAEQGAYVSTGQPLFILVGNERWVVANFKEVQLTHMRPGQKVLITVDAYPTLNLEGRIDSIQSGTGARFSAFPAENATGNFVKIVQRVPVKITFKTKIPEHVVLGPGLSVYPTVYTGASHDSTSR
jgi:membrane fusion protein (multidrug efflux system)